MPTETKYCGTATGWGTQENADKAEGVEDDVCALTSINGSILYLDGFGFAFTSDPSYVGVDCKAIVVSDTTQQCDFYVWDGNDWVYFATIEAEYQEFPALKCGDSYFRGWHDLSNIIDTKEKLNGIKFKAIHYNAGGGGTIPAEMWSSYIDAIKVKASLERVFGDGLFWRKS